jgi:hypothetical protein
MYAINTGRRGLSKGESRFGRKCKMENVEWKSVVNRKIPEDFEEVSLFNTLHFISLTII